MNLSARELTNQAPMPLILKNGVLMMMDDMDKQINASLVNK
jgi:hypothetical protein